MAERELRKLKRRDLLQMLLVQCEETERLQKETAEMKTELETLTESYERLKIKLNIKDERLNEKDARITELRSKIGQMQESREIELEEAGSIAEAALRLNGVFEAAQHAAEQYLMNVRRITGNALASVSESLEEPVKKEEQLLLPGELPGQQRSSVSGTAPEQGQAAAEEKTAEERRREAAGVIAVPARMQTAADKAASDNITENRNSYDTGWRAGIRKRQPRTRQIISMNINQDMEWAGGSASGDNNG